MTYELYKDNLDEIVECSCYIAEESGFQGEKLFCYKLAVDEVCNNSLKHAYNGEKGSINVIIDIEDDYLVTEIKDFGCGFQMSDIAVEKNEQIDVPKSSGRGLLIVKEFTDKIEICSLPGKGTTVKFYIKMRNG